MADARTERWEQVLQADEELLIWVVRQRRAWLSPLMRAFTRIGNGSSWTLLGLVLLAFSETRPVALAIAGSAILTTVLVQIAKRTCRRARPELGELGLAALVAHPDHYSFPSGHTAAAMAVAVSLLPAPGIIGSVALFLACAIGVSRLYLGAHYPLDVAAGALLGVMVGACVGPVLF